ncbi:MAG: membrane protein [Clostridiaceae bacterium BRH_c20a]|nr:MAG: membrane protein [Clostridiaceae bacterium BRH_c20a]
MKRETIFLKLAVFLIGTPVLALCIFGLPWIAKDAAESGSELAYFLYGILIVMYISAIPFFVTLYQAFRLLSYIDKNKAFSELSVRALRNIKFCALTISVLYLISMPFFFLIGEIDDAPGVIVIGMVLTFAPMVIAVFAAILQKLLKDAIDIKNDNDLTI